MLQRLCVVAIATFLPSQAFASEPQGRQPDAGPYRFRFALDAPLVALGLAGSAAFFVEPTPPACVYAPAGCSAPPNLNAIDRRVLGMYSRPALAASNAVIAAIVLAPHALHLLSEHATWRSAFEDAAITAESVLVAQALTQVVKAATDRNAPLIYNARVPVEVKEGPDASRSFWSGHTATAFSAATSFAVSYWLRHPKSPWRWVVLAGVESAALCAGLLKIRAGFHYPTDVAAGALAGAGVGLLVPLLHWDKAW